MKHIKKYKKGGKKFPDLTGDGKVTFADILKGRGVKKAMKGMKYEDGGKAPKKMKKKTAKAVPNYKKGVSLNKARKELNRVLNYRSYREGKGGNQPLAQELLGKNGMKYEGGGKLDRGGNATKEYKKQKGKEAKHYRKGMIAKTKAGESIHRTMRKRAARKAEAVSGKFKDSNEKSNYTYASFKNGGKKAMYGMKHKNK